MFLNDPICTGAEPATSGPGWGQQMRRSRLSPHTFSRTCPMIFRFLATSEVSLARLSCEMIGAQVLMGTHALLMGHVEIEFWAVTAVVGRRRAASRWVAGCMVQVRGPGYHYTHHWSALNSPC